MLSRFKPTLILMDVQLPGIDGLALTRQLRTDAATKDVVVLAVSASASRVDEENAFAAGCDGFVEKPIDIVSPPRVDCGVPRGAVGAAMSAAPILIVEDNAVSRKMMRVALKAEGYAVLEAESGQAALHLASAHEPAMVLLTAAVHARDAAGLSVGAILLSGMRAESSPSRQTWVLRPIFPGNLYVGVLCHAMVYGVLLGPSAELGRDGYDLLGALGVASALVVPIVARGEALGVLLLASNRTDLADVESDAFVRVARSVSGSSSARLWL